MTLPKERLSINRSEHELLSPGLELLANGLANAKLGLFPHRQPWHRVDLIASDVYRGQAYDQEMADRVIAIRRKMWAINSARRVRFDVFELAAAAFALRLFKTGRKKGSYDDMPAKIRRLADRLEKFRKRAKRATRSRFGPGVCRDQQERWSNFGSWARYNLLHFKVNPNLKGFRRQLWREQRFILKDLITKAIDDRRYGRLAEPELDRVTRLLKESLRRVRHRLSLREVLNGSSDAMDLIFDFVRQRHDLVALPGAVLTPCEAASLRADKFREARVKRQSGPAPSRTISAPSGTPSQPSPPTRTEPEIKVVDRTPLTISEPETIEAIARWCRDNLEPDLLVPVRDNCQFRIRFNYLPLEPVYARSLDDLIATTVPATNVEDGDWEFEIYNHYTNWLLNWTYSLHSNPFILYRVVVAGIELAMARSGAAA